LPFKVLRPTRHKVCYFGDVLPSQSLGLVLKKANPTQQKQTTEEQNDKIAYKKKPKSKENLNQQLTLRTAHMCVCIPLCTSVVYNAAQKF